MAAAWEQWCQIESTVFDPALDFICLVTASLSTRGQRLVVAPAYDMNPVATGGGLSLNVSECDNAQDLTLARDVAKHFGVKAARAEEIIEQVVGVVQTWRAEASAVGLPRSDQDRMAPAFHLAEEER